MGTRINIYTPRMRFWDSESGPRERVYIIEYAVAIIQAFWLINFANWLSAVSFIIDCDVVIRRIALFANNKFRSPEGRKFNQKRPYGVRTARDFRATRSSWIICPSDELLPLPGVLIRLTFEFHHRILCCHETFYANRSRTRRGYTYNRTIFSGFAAVLERLLCFFGVLRLLNELSDFMSF